MANGRRASCHQADAHHQADAPVACVTVTSAVAPVHLGTAGGFALLTKSGITSTGNTSVGGDIGTSPIAATAITGFALTNITGELSTSALVNGKVYAASHAGHDDYSHL